MEFDSPNFFDCAKLDLVSGCERSVKTNHANFSALDTLNGRDEQLSLNVKKANTILDEVTKQLSSTRYTAVLCCHFAGRSTQRSLAVFAGNHLSKHFGAFWRLFDSLH